jgi:hypothetical protein
MNYHCSLCNYPEERSSYPFRGGSLISHNVIVVGFHLTTGALREVAGSDWGKLNFAKV